MAAIIPASMSIEFITAQGAGANPELHQKRCDHLDQQVSKLVLGQTTSTDAISGGHAVSQEHREVAGDIERADALLLSSTLTEQVVPWLIALNFGPQEEYPVLAIGRPDEVDLDKWVAAIKDLAPLGLRVEASQIYDRLGIEEPEDGAEVIGGGAAAGPASDPLAGLFARKDVMALFDQAAKERASVPAPFDTLRKQLASQQDPDLVEALARRTALDAAGALGGMTAEIRAVFDQASSLEDAKERLDKLSLDPKAFAEAMARGIALADLAGRAALFEDLERGDG
jgi:phage gp29-like protein